MRSIMKKKLSMYDFPAPQMKKVIGEVELTVDDRKVNLPKKVTIFDATSGLRIGYIDRADVFALLEKDKRYDGYEDSATGEFALSYDARRAYASVVEMEINSVIDYYRAIRDHLESAISADDPRRLRLGVSYVINGSKFVAYLSIRRIHEEGPILKPEILDAIKNNTDGLIAYIRSQVAKEPLKVPKSAHLESLDHKPIIPLVRKGKESGERSEKEKDGTITDIQRENKLKRKKKHGKV